MRWRAHTLRACVCTAALSMAQMGVMALYVVAANIFQCGYGIADKGRPRAHVSSSTEDEESATETTSEIASSSY